MITSEKYTILEKEDNIPQIETELCIINFDIINNTDYVKNLISKNKHTTFWAVSDNFSKEYVKTVAKLGIQNIVKYPISTNIIEKFFSDKENEKDIITNYHPLTNSKVLIADDNDMNITLLKETLEDTGAKLTCTESSQKALQIIGNEKFDLLLLDILMPNISGFELAEYARNSSPNKNTPIIFISAVSGTENILNGYQLGACSYIEKPFSPHIVKAQIYNLLKTEADKQQKEREKDSFVAALTHDLKNPILAEINALKYLSKDKEYSSEMVDGLLNSAKYMKHITDQILSHYKQEQTTLKLIKEEISLNKIILMSIEELKYLAVDKELEIRYNNVSENKTVPVDVIEIKRVINNLLSNAIEYSKNGSQVDITLSNNSEFYKVTIKDYGTGIDLNKYDKVFEEYVSLSKEHKKIGFGLGLKISKNIIEAHDGSIKIKSEPNKGTEVSFTIPA